MRVSVYPWLGLLSLGLLACAPVVVWHGRSPNRARRAVIVEDDERQRLLLDDDAEQTWDAIAVSHLRWTEAGIVYPAREGERWHLVANGRAGAAHEGIGFVHPFGEHVAYAAQEPDGWHVVVDGRAGPAFTSLRASTLVSAEDRVAYIGRDERGEHVVVDGGLGDGPLVDGPLVDGAGAHGALVGPAFDIIQGLQFGAKGSVLAYVGYDAGGARLVIDGAQGAAHFEDIFELAVAPDEPRWAAIGGRDEMSSIVHDGRVIAEVASASQLTLSRDGSRIAWVVSTEDRQEVWLDGGRVGSYPAVERLRFVPRTGRLVFVVADPDGARVVHDGVAGPRFDEIEGPSVSRAGHWGYVGIRRVGCAAVIDGELVHRGEWAGALRLAARSDRWAFLARHAGRRFVVTPDERVPVARTIVDTFVLDSEGVHWAVVVADAEHRRLEVVVDGHVVAPLDMDEVSASEVQVHHEGDLAAVVRAIVTGELRSSQEENSEALSSEALSSGAQRSPMRSRGADPGP